MATEETPEQRFARDYGAMATNDPGRKDRTLDNQSDERQARLYVDPATIENEDPYSGTSATGKTYTP